MKFVIALCILSTILLQCHTSPVPLVENRNEVIAKSRDLSRQAVSNDIVPEVAPVPGEDDDEDDDDDDDEDDDDDADLGDLVDDDDGKFACNLINSS